MQEKEKPNYRIGWLMIFVCLVAACVADLITLIPFIGIFVGPIYWVIFSWYLARTNHKLLSWKIFMPEIISIGIEMIPVLQELPGIVAGTIVILVVSRSEDALKLSARTAKKGLSRVTARLRHLPFNENGIRGPRKDVGDEEVEESEELDMAA